jgi:hypothetical protein
VVVLLPDGAYRVGKPGRPHLRDAHGSPVPTEPVWTAYVAGASARQADGSWSLRLGVSVWPVAAGDLIEREADGGQWSVTGTPRRHQVPGAPDVDHVTVVAVQVPPDVDLGYPS